MTTQYTTILKLALPVQGELSGTWGDIVNNNITQMVEQAVAGKATVNSWTGNAHTLTTADGTTAESRCAILELTDTGTALSGAGTVTCPTNTKLYIVDNNTAQIITVKTSGGTGVAVPVGKTMLVYCDGTNVVEGVTHANSLSLGTSTSTVNAIATATDLGAGGSSNSNLPTQLAVKTYVDSQVGTVDTLAEILANGNVTGANDIDVENAQKVQFRDSAIYINSSADGQLDLVADTEIQIAASTVDLNGNLDISGTATGASSFATAAGGTFTTAAGNDLNLVYPDSRSLFIKEGSATHVTVDNAGKVGIGVTPAAPLNVAKNGDGTIVRLLSVGIGEWDFSMGNSSTLTGVGAGALELLPLNSGTGSEFAIGQAGSSTPVFHVKSGNVAIGTATTTGKSGHTNIFLGGTANIYADTAATADASLSISQNAHVDSDSSWEYRVTDEATNYYQNAGNHVWRYAASGTAGADISWSEAMRINASGNVGIGTSSIDGTLHVHTASAGTVSASSQADDLVIENSAEGGMTIITPDDQSARIRFTSPSTNNDVGGATIFYRQNINKMLVGTAVSGGVLSLASGAGVETMTLNASNSVGIGVADGDVTSDGTAARTYVGIIGTANRGRLNLGTTASNGADSGYLGFTNGANDIGSIVMDTTPGVQNTGTMYVNSTKSIKIQAAASDEVVFNESGVDTDFRVESDGNSNILFVDAGNNRVGIGDNTTDAGTILTVAGAATFTGQNTAHGASRLKIGQESTAISQIRFYGANTSTAGILQFTTSSSDGSVGGEVFRLTAARDMYFGQTSGSAADVGHIMQANGALYNTAHETTVQYLRRLSTDGAIVQFNKDSVVVGSIGVANGDLHIDGDTGIRFQDTSLMPRRGGSDVDDTVTLGLSSHKFKSLFLSNNISLSNATTSAFIQVSDNIFQLGTSSSDPVVFYAANAEAARFDTSQNFLVRCTDTPSASQAGFMFTSDQLYTSAGNTTSNNTQVRFINGNGLVGNISTAGSGTAYATSSDQRLKDNIVDAPSASDDIDAIQVRSFDWKS